MGRSTTGVRGIKLKTDDIVVGMDVFGKGDDADVLVIMENGLGKKTDLSFYKIQKRGGSGIKTLKVTDKTGKIISMHIVTESEEHDLVLFSRSGQARKNR